MSKFRYSAMSSCCSNVRPSTYTRWSRSGRAPRRPTRRTGPRCSTFGEPPSFSATLQQGGRAGAVVVDARPTHRGAPAITTFRPPVRVSAMTLMLVRVALVPHLDRGGLAGESSSAAVGLAAADSDRLRLAIGDVGQRSGRVVGRRPRRRLRRRGVQRLRRRCSHRGGSGPLTGEVLAGEVGRLAAGVASSGRRTRIGPVMPAGGVSGRRILSTPVRGPPTVTEAATTSTGNSGVRTMKPAGAAGPATYSTLSS